MRTPILPAPLASAFSKVLEALRPLSFDERHRVLVAAISVTDRRESEARVSQIGNTIPAPTLPSIHPDKWTVPPKGKGPPPLPPSERVTRRSVKPRRNTK